MYINRTIKCLKRLQKRSIDDNLRQLVFIRQDREWVGRAMRNETFNGDGRSVGSPSELGSDEIWWITPSYQWHRHRQSGFVSRNFRESPGQICIICQTNFISVFFNKMFVCEDGSSFYFLKRRNNLNFRSFWVLEYWRNDSFPNKDFAEIVLTILRQRM